MTVSKTIFEDLVLSFYKKKDQAWCRIIEESKDYFYGLGAQQNLHDSINEAIDFVSLGNEKNQRSYELFKIKNLPTNFESDLVSKVIRGKF